MKLYKNNHIYSDTHYKDFDKHLKYLCDWVKDDWKMVREYSIRPEYIDKKLRTHFEVCGYTYRDHANIVMIMNPLTSTIRIKIDLGFLTLKDGKKYKPYSIHVRPRVHIIVTKEKLLYIEAPRITKKMKVKLGSIHYS